MSHALALDDLGAPFRRVYADHAPMVRAALRQLGVAPASLEDATQDVFVVLYRRAADYDAERNLKNWLWGIARGVASTYRRTDRRRHRLVGALPRDAHSPPLEREVARGEATDILDRFLATLDADKCAVFVLSEVEGRSGAEISRMLEVNVNTVYARLRAARRHFADAVAEHGEPTGRPLFAAWLPAAWMPRAAMVAAGVGAMVTALSLPAVSEPLPEATEPTLARVVIPDQVALDVPPPPTVVVPARRTTSRPRPASVDEDTIVIEEIAEMEALDAESSIVIEDAPRRRGRRSLDTAAGDVPVVDRPPVVAPASNVPLAVPPMQPWGDRIVARAPSRTVAPLVAPRPDFVGKLGDLADSL